MTEAIKCDRCGKVEDKPLLASCWGGASACLPPSWEELGKYHLCAECAVWFRRFLVGEGTLAKEVAP